jgi:hypothetical protein
MTQESNVDDAVVPKLLIDRPSDFRSHAAYLIYSQAWDKTSSQEVKIKLNEIMASLFKDEIDYETFYGKISQYRVEFNPEHYYVGTRARIETQRKRDWRRREAKSARNARHRGR